MSTAFERFICKLHDYFKVKDCSIMKVGRMSEAGTVVTFEVEIGDTNRNSSIIFEAKVAKGGIKVEPTRIVQITDVHRVYLWSYFFNDLHENKYKFRAFMIKWNECDDFWMNEKAWVGRTTKRHDLEKNEIE